VYPRISPDGNRLAVGTDDGKSANVWIYDLSGAGAMRQLTLGGKNRFPVWSPDGQWVAFQSDRDGDLAIFRQRADGGTAAERLTKPDQGTAHIPESWSPDGRTLSFSEAKGETFVLWMLSLPDKKTARFGNVQSTLDPVTSVFSPDGHWIAYTSSDGDNRTIFVQELAATAIKHPIVKGAWHPLWSPDGTELFYRVGVSTREEVVKVTTKPSFSVGNPEMVSTGLIRSRGRYPREYDITPDGKRFIGVIAAGQTQSGARATPQINVVLNWFEELKSRLPVMK
jgi:Tol biopolymer transport system component